jgi:hypothetical protein
MSNIVKVSMPMPTRTAFNPVGKRGSKYDLASLTAGSDEAIVLEGLDPKKDHSKLSSAVANFRKAGGEGKFAIRTFTVEEDGVQKTKVGVWRTA